jgi:hypothetical protein
VSDTVSDDAPKPPVLRIVRGSASPEELAAVVAVLAARGGGSAVEEPAAEPSLWGAPQLRGAVHAGPSAWKASALPR